MRATTLLMAILIALSLAQPGWGANGSKGKGKERGGGGMSSSQAAQTAQRQTGGRVLSVKESSGGYRVKVLTPSGEVRDVFVPGGGR
ncbi:MAG: hypothetical protein MUC77_16280 [Chromatiaceae bacterium]|jgi:hypothetical protein|nr:hypothetical protein [Chromatiaceae bacterium]